MNDVMKSVLWLLSDGYVVAFLFGWIAAMLTHILWNGIQIRRNSERIRRKSEMLQMAGLPNTKTLVCASCGLELGHELNCAKPDAPKVRTQWGRCYCGHLSNRHGPDGGCDDCRCDNFRNGRREEAMNAELH